MIDSLRTLCAEKETAEGPDAKIELKASQLKFLLGALSDQEREILGMERAYETMKDRIQSLIDTLDCYDFDKFAPEDDCDGEIFEIFIGSLEDNGRIFGFWDASSRSFHEPADDKGQVFYREDVVFWRYALPEPHEALDLGDPL